MVQSTNTSRISWTVGLAILAGGIQYVVRRMLEAWGILDPMAITIGGWFGRNITTGQVGWTIASIIAIFLYIVALVVIWRRNRPPQDDRVASTESTEFTQAKANLAREERLQDKQDQLRQGLRGIAGKVFGTRAGVVRDWNIIQAQEHWDRVRGDVVGVFEELVQAAADGRVVIWGKKDGFESAVYEAIPNAHWAHSDIHIHAVMLSPSDSVDEEFILKNSRTRPRNPHDTEHDQFSHLRVSSKEIVALWPEENT